MPPRKKCMRRSWWDKHQVTSALMIPVQEWIKPHLPRDAWPMEPVRKNFLKLCLHSSTRLARETTSYPSWQAPKWSRLEGKISPTGALRAGPSSVGSLVVMSTLRQVQVHHLRNIAPKQIEITKIRSFQFLKVQGFIYPLAILKFKNPFQINIKLCSLDFRPRIPGITVTMVHQWVMARKVISRMAKSSISFQEPSINLTKSTP